MLCVANVYNTSYIVASFCVVLVTWKIAIHLDEIVRQLWMNEIWKGKKQPSSFLLHDVKQMSVDVLWMSFSTK